MALVSCDLLERKQLINAKKRKKEDFTSFVKGDEPL
jgi:hypothetical protein